jgi:adenylyltransferase/sulfurtransferase
MFIFDGLNGVSRTVKLRNRQPNCAVCGETPSISSLIDYQHFCAGEDKSCSVSLLAMEDRISCQDYHSLAESGVEHFLVDVRPKTEFSICHLQNSISILCSLAMHGVICGVLILS